MSEPRVVRLFTFRPVRSAFDGILRDVMLPDLRGLSGLVDIHLGRRGPDELGPRLLATVWSSQAEMVAAFGEDPDRPTFHAEFLEEMTEWRVESRPLAISMAYEGSEPRRILRTLRGRVRPGQREVYIDHANQGYLGDIAAGRGPLALHLGTGPGDDDFVTTSVWDTWTKVEAATGGDIRQPMATRHADLIVAWEATHFEVIEG